MKFHPGGPSAQRAPEPGGPSRAQVRTKLLAFAGVLLALFTPACESIGSAEDVTTEPDSRFDALLPLVERCNGRDDDRDGETDEGPAVGCLAKLEDMDGDTFGVPTSVCECNPKRVGLSNGLDCDDTDPDRHPGVLEVCNGTDDNCDSETDNLAVNPNHADGENCGACGVVCDPLLDVCREGECIARCGDGQCDVDESPETCCVDCGCHQAFGECTEQGCICEPRCGVGSECGYDGCGGKCGSCGPWERCEAGTCIQIPCGTCQNFGEEWCDGGSVVRCDQDENGCGVHTTTPCAHGCSNGGCLTGGSSSGGCVNDTSDCPVNQKVRCDGYCAYRCTFDLGWQHWKLIGSCAVYGSDCLCVAIGPTDTVLACGRSGKENNICGFP